MCFMQFTLIIDFALLKPLIINLRILEIAIWLIVNIYIRIDPYLIGVNVSNKFTISPYKYVLLLIYAIK